MEKEKGGYVYIMGNVHHTTLYAGVTNDLARRVLDHRSRKYEGFAKKYNCVKLLYWDWYDDIEGAIMREKLIKGGSRAAKDKLIETKNPEWRDLATDFHLKPLPQHRAVSSRGGCFAPNGSRNDDHANATKQPLNLSLRGR